MAGGRLVRTYLAVPAHRQKLVEGAARSSADAVFLDLEDAVPPAEKTTALKAAVAAVAGLNWGEKTLTVRLNAIDSGTIWEEVGALSGLARLDGFILPKAEAPADVAALFEASRAACGARSTPPEIELLIETARGMVMIDVLAAQPGVTALHLGVGDLAASLGARSSEIGASPRDYRLVGRSEDGAYDTPLDYFAYPMMRLLIAARAFGLRAIDGPCGAFRDEATTAATAQKAAAMGFDGKQVIHPTQIAPTRDAFVPAPEDVAYALKVQAALDEAALRGLGAVTVDGRMIDLANARMIRRTLQLAGIG